MQELIDDIGKYIKVDWPMNKSIRNSINKGLEKEKEQICNAYTDVLEGPYIGAEQYYNQTYNQESQEYLKKQRDNMENFIWNRMNKNNL